MHLKFRQYEYITARLLCPKLFGVEFIFLLRQSCLSDIDHILFVKMKNGLFIDSWERYGLKLTMECILAFPTNYNQHSNIV